MRNLFHLSAVLYLLHTFLSELLTVGKHHDVLHPTPFTPPHPHINQIWIRQIYVGEILIFNYTFHKYLISTG